MQLLGHTVRAQDRVIGHQEFIGGTAHLFRVCRSPGYTLNLLHEDRVRLERCAGRPHRERCSVVTDIPEEACQSARTDTCPHPKRCSAPSSKHPCNPKRCSAPSSALPCNPVPKKCGCAKHIMIPALLQGPRLRCTRSVSPPSATSPFSRRRSRTCRASGARAQGNSIP